MNENEIGLGKMGDKIRKIKIESPLGIPVTKNSTKKFLFFNYRQKKESEIIILAQPIIIGEKIVKICEIKKDRIRSKKTFYATISPVTKIEKIDGCKTFNISTVNSKYKITLL